MKKLLIVDMQKGFIRDFNQDIVEKVEKLIAGGGFAQIIATKFVNKKNSAFVKNLKWNRFLCEDETALAIKLPQNAIVVEKTTYALKESDLKKLFNKDDEVYVCGFDYDACVLAVLFQLFDHGFQPHILLNCVGTHSDHSIQINDFEKICIKNFGKNSLEY